MADPRAPTRADLAKFLPDQRTIRAFEKLFELIPDDFTQLIEEAMLEAGVASNQAMQANDAIARIADGVDYLAKAPVPSQRIEEALARIADAVDYLAKAPTQEAQDQIRVSYVDFDTTPSVVAKNGRVWWNADENCLNIAIGESVLQVGFEQYMRTENDTGATIANGSVVGFAGVNGEIKISKYIADGSVSSLYFIGIATQEFSDGEIGQVTTFGKVRGLDTSSWSTGTILYASPTTAGELTSTRPTAPDNVIVVAAVLVSDATNGEIFVRPTIPLGLDYAQFSDTTDQTLAAADTAYAVTFNTTDVSHGVTVVSSSQITVEQAGLYSLSVSLQVTSSNASSVTVYSWLAKNGTDVANTRRDLTIKANGDTKVMSLHYQVSLAASDYIEIMWAGSSTSMNLDAIAATAFAPAAPSAMLSVEQIQL